MTDLSTMTKNALNEVYHNLLDMFLQFWPAIWPYALILVIGLLITWMRKWVVNWYAVVVSGNRREARVTAKRINSLFDLFDAFREIFPHK